MSRTLAQKLGVAPGQRLLVLNAPDHYLELLGVPADVRVDTADHPAAAYDGVHLFVRDLGAVQRDLPRVLGRVGGARLWVCYPKRSGGIRTDISRDTGWEVLGAAGWDSVAQVAIDTDWSALRFRPRSDITYTPGSARRRAGEPPRQGD